MSLIVSRTLQITIWLLIYTSFLSLTLPQPVIYSGSLYFCNCPTYPEQHGEQAELHRTERNLKVLVTQHVTDPLAHYYRGVSLYFLGYAEKAAQELKAVLKVLPDGDDSLQTRHYLKLIAAGHQVADKKQLSLTALLRIWDSIEEPARPVRS